MFLHYVVSTLLILFKHINKQLCLYAFFHFELVKSKQMPEKMYNRIGVVTFFESEY